MNQAPASAVLWMACSERAPTSPPTPLLDQVEAALAPGRRIARGSDAALIHPEALGVSAVDSLAVRIIEGSPRALTVIHRHEQSHDDRELQEIVASGDGEVYIANEMQDDVVVAFHDDDAGFRILGRRRPGQPIRFQHDAHAIRMTLERHLSREPGPRVRLPTLTLGEREVGRLAGPPNRPTAYRLELTQPRQVLVHFELPTGVEAFVVLCHGELNPLACVDRGGLEPADIEDSDTVAAIVRREVALEDQGRATFTERHRLRAGTTTLVIEPDCSYGAQCRYHGADFSIVVE